MFERVLTFKHTELIKHSLFYFSFLSSKHMPEALINMAHWYYSSQIKTYCKDTWFLTQTWNFESSLQISTVILIDPKNPKNPKSRNNGGSGGKMSLEKPPVTTVLKLRPERIEPQHPKETGLESWFK